MLKQFRPTKVKRILCPKCGELMVKIYPWSSMDIAPGSPINPCKKCRSKDLRVIKK